MPVISRAEAYFIGAMMFLILILCVATVFFFIKTYKREMREKKERLDAKGNVSTENEIGYEELKN